MKTIIKWLSIIALFAVCQSIAFSQRGYFAIGGEFFIIAVPVWYSIYKAAMRMYGE